MSENRVLSTFASESESLGLQNSSYACQKYEDQKQLANGLHSCIDSVTTECLICGKPVYKDRMYRKGRHGQAFYFHKVCFTKLWRKERIDNHA